MSKPFREFVINADKINELTDYGSNYVSTTKYSIVTFVPKSLLYQFMRLANIYFLITAVVQCIPAISPLTPLTAILPLAFVLIVSMIREGIEDYRRYTDDCTANSQPVRVLSANVPDKSELDRKKEYVKQDFPAFDLNFPPCFNIVRSQDLKVGQVVLMCEEEIFPADLILLGTSDKDNKAYIETAMLDGEKNLKKRQADSNINPLSQRDRFIFHAKVHCERPTHELDKFGASIYAKNFKVSISDKHLMMKGAKLKNTPWITGVVAFTGKQTKLMLNTNQGRLKQSRVESIMNNLIIIILCVQLVVCIILGILAAIWQANYSEQHSYLEYTKTAGVIFVYSFFAYFLLLNTLIPISLIVTLEIVKFLQLFFMQWDVFMYQNDHFAKVSTCTINEELGQVRYIFSDKTGTLTCNKMVLKGVRVFNKCYGESLMGETPKILRKRTRMVGKDIAFEFEDKELETILESKNPVPAKEPYTVKINGGGNYTLKTDQEIAYEFFKLIACCHEVTSLKGKDSFYVYGGQSPDEVCLVDAAQRIAVTFIDNRSDVLSIAIAGSKAEPVKTTTIDLMAMFPFDSQRARMSVIVKEPDGTAKLYCKGSDERVLKLLSIPETEHDKNPLLAETKKYLAAASGRGLRTLCMAMKVFQPAEFEAWKKEMDAVKLFVPSSSEEAKAKKDQMNALIAEAEAGLTYLGCTVVEDKLQDNVENTIHNLEKAGIQVWMITGDKMETAESIGYSCKMFTKGDMDVLVIGDEYFDKATNTVREEKALACLKERLNAPEIPGRKKGMLITGTLVEHLVKAPDTRDTFITYAKKCSGVVCCRTTATQKAVVVKAMKEACVGEITLSIGDGGNDVPMINEAHVGVGIYGKEGMQAAQASDYAIGEFQCLWNLLMVHGRLAYMRIGELILYFFYKNAVFTLPQLYFAFWCFFSGQTFYDDWYISLYNLFFTSIPLLFKALYEQDLHHVLDRKLPLNSIYPFLYLRGQANQIFNLKNIAIWFSYGIFHSCIAFFLPYAFMQNLVLTSDGENVDLWFHSITSFTSIIIIVNLKLYSTERIFTWVSLLGFFALSVGFYVAVQWASNSMTLFVSYNTVIMIYQSWSYYFCVILCVLLTFAFDHFIQVWSFHIEQNTSDFCRLWARHYDPSNDSLNKACMMRLKAIDAKERTAAIASVTSQAPVVKVDMPNVRLNT